MFIYLPAYFYHILYSIFYFETWHNLQTSKILNIIKVGLSRFKKHGIWKKIIRSNNDKRLYTEEELSNVKRLYSEREIRKFKDNNILVYRDIFWISSEA